MQLTRTAGFRRASSTAKLRVMRGDRPLAGEIGRIVGIGPGGGPIADRDDRAALRLLDHDQARPLATEERAQGVDLELPANVVGGHVLQAVLAAQTAAAVTSTSSRPKVAITSSNSRATSASSATSA